MGNKQNKKKKNKKDNIIIKKKEEIMDYKKEVYKYNIIFHGEAGIGNITGLIKKIMGDKFIPCRLVQRLILEKNNIEIRLYLFDASDKNKNISGILFSISDCIILGYDISNEQSFEKIKNAYFEKKKYIKTNLIYLLGNKNDLK